MYYLYLAGFYMARALPLRVCYALAEVLARIYWAVAREDRKSIRENMKVMFGDTLTEKEIDRHVFGLFRNFAKYLADFFKFPKLTRDEVYRTVEVVGTENIDKCLAAGKGAILLSMHLGNWEMGGQVIGALGYPLHAIALEHGDKRINDLFLRQRGMNDMKVIPLGIQVKQCFNVLKRNELLAIVGDKDYTSNGEYIEFFGKKAFIPKGPAFFSLKTGAPILLTVVVRKSDDTFRVSIDKPISFEPTGDRDKDITALMREYLKVMESYIRETPEQWYAFRRVWDQEKTIQ
jgi:lauroyl/myristoyl acyltransferase